MTNSDAAWARVAGPEATHRWQRRFIYELLALLVRLLLRVDVRGIEHVPRSGPLVLYYNHIHFADPFLLELLMRDVRFTVPIAKRELADVPFVGKLVQWFGVIFVDRGSTDMQAIRASLAVLQNGHALLISPEGTRTPDAHSLMPAQKGMGMLVRRTQAAMLPIAVVDTPRLTEGWKRLRRYTVSVQFGRPFHLDPPAGMHRRDIEEEITQYAMQELAALLPESMQGAYTPPSAPHPWLTRS